MKRKQKGEAKFICNCSKDEFIKKVRPQIGLFNAERKTDFAAEIKEGNLSIGLGRTGHGSGLWYEPAITEKDNSIIIDGKINDVSWHDGDTKWWENLIIWLFVLIPLYIVLSPYILFRAIFSPFSNTPQRQLKKFMAEYMDCAEIRKNKQDKNQARMTKADTSIQNKDSLKQDYEKAFGIVKKYIDDLDLMGLLAVKSPEDEYEIEVAEIVRSAVSANNENELADVIVRTFEEAFGETFDAQRKQILEASSNILQEMKALRTDE